MPVGASIQSARQCDASTRYVYLGHHGRHTRDRIEQKMRLLSIIASTCALRADGLRVMLQSTNPKAFNPEAEFSSTTFGDLATPPPLYLSTQSRGRLYQ